MRGNELKVFDLAFQKWDWAFEYCWCRGWRGLGCASVSGHFKGKKDTNRNSSGCNSTRLQL